MILNLRTAVNIECPSCAANNEVKLNTRMHCKQCEEDLANHSYKRQGKSILSITGALALGAFSYQQIDEHFLTKDRYPLRVEYSIVEGCIRGDATPVHSYLLQAKRKMCLCGLEKTTHQISYNEYKKDKKNFYRSFASNALDCQ